jgi:hypothetical protein
VLTGIAKSFKQSPYRSSSVPETFLYTTDNQQQSTAETIYIYGL